MELVYISQGSVLNDLYIGEDVTWCEALDRDQVAQMRLHKSIVHNFAWVSGQDITKLPENASSWGKFLWEWLDMINPGERVVDD